MRPHRRQPTRLPRPWDSPGKNTGVGCHFLLQCMKVKSESEVAQSCPTPSGWPHGLQPTRLLRPWDFPGKSTGVGCHCLLRLRFEGSRNRQTEKGENGYLLHHSSGNCCTFMWLRFLPLWVLGSENHWSAIICRVFLWGVEVLGAPISPTSHFQ